MERNAKYAEVKYNPELINILKRDVQTASIYKAQAKFPTFSPICCMSKKLVKLPLRSKLCMSENCIKCIYSSDFLDNKDEQFSCSSERKTSSYDQLFIDYRLANLITSALEKQSEDSLRKSEVGVNAQSLLYMVVEDRTYVEKTNTSTSGARIAQESNIESKSEIQATLRKKCFQFLSTKQKIGLLDGNIEEETKAIIGELSKQSFLCEDINKRAKPYREIQKNMSLNLGCLFGFFKGKLFCGFHETQVEEYKIANQNLQNKNALETFYGGSWVFVDIPVPRILVIGGTSSFSQEKVGKNMMEFTLSPGSKSASWKPKLLKNDMEELNVYHAGVIYAESKKTIWIMGGLKRNANKPMAFASKNIYRMDISNNDYKITPVAELQIKRFNQSYTLYKDNIYISCGVPIKDWGSEFSIEDTAKGVKDKESQGHYNPHRLEVFNINDSKIRSFEIILDNRTDSYIYRCMSTVVSAPKRQSNILVIFGGNPNCYGVGEFAMAIDLKNTEYGPGQKVHGKDFGEEQFKREIYVGDEQVISKMNNVVDLQGVRSENYSEWLCVNSEKVQQFALTSQECDFGYRWRY